MNRIVSCLILWINISSLAFADISKEKQLDIIIPAAQALYYRDDLDISAEVLAKLNKKITKVDVKFE